MRPSKRHEILDAATRVVQREGVTTLTYESVAAEAGMTKGGAALPLPVPGGAAARTAPACG